MFRKIKLGGVFVEIIKSHNLVSRSVNGEDLDRVKKDAVELARLCKLPKGLKTYAFALAHCQITDQDPLRFFVNFYGDIIINPVITKRLDKPYREKEGCMSFAELPDITVLRNHLIEVEYFILDMGMMIKTNQVLRDLNARIFQHEIDHFDGKNIYGR